MSVSIGIAYYMPNSDKTVIIPGRVGQLVALRRGLLSKTIKLLQLVLLGDSEPSLDDAITCFIVSSIGPSEDETETNLAQWLAFMKLNVTILVLNAEAENVDEEEKEERRRCAEFNSKCF
jgi:hypothetical protein